MLNTKQVNAIRCLLSCSTREEAAAKAGITSKTMRSYLQNEEFKQEYMKQCTEMIEDATQQSQKALTTALHTLQSIASDEKEKATARVYASRSLIDAAVRLTELYDLAERVERIENELSEGA